MLTTQLLTQRECVWQTCLEKYIEHIQYSQQNYLSIHAIYNDLCSIYCMQYNILFMSLGHLQRLVQHILYWLQNYSCIQLKMSSNHVKWINDIVHYRRVKTIWIWAIDWLIGYCHCRWMEQAKILYGTSAMQDWSEDHQLLVVHRHRRAQTMWIWWVSLS